MTELLDSFFSVDTLGIKTAHGSAPPLVVEAMKTLAPEEVSGSVGQGLLKNLNEAGALLIRNLPIQSPETFKSYVRSILGDAPPFLTGEHPRNKDDAEIQEPVRFAPSEKLLWHHENSFNHMWPRYIAFGCAQKANMGGETPIVDGRLVYNRANSDAISKFEEVGIAYRRLCDGRTSRTWQQIYGTSEKDEALAIARTNHERLSFSDEGALVESVRPAFISVSKQRSWFNQLLHWHPRALPEDIQALIAAGRLPIYRNCAFGDGLPIQDEVVDEIIQIHSELEYPINWENGDILFLDNRIFSHGRNRYSGTRKHFVTMSTSDSYEKHMP